MQQNSQRKAVVFRERHQEHKMLTFVRTGINSIKSDSAGPDFVTALPASKVSRLAPHPVRR
jgi:hypothetical protein